MHENRNHFHINSLTFSLALRARLNGGGVGEVTRGGLPHLSCKRDRIKMRDYMGRQVTTPKRVGSRT